MEINDFASFGSGTDGDSSANIAAFSDQELATPEPRKLRRKSIPGFEGFYEADGDGNIHSLARKVVHSRGGKTFLRRVNPCTLKPTLDRYGYLNVAIMRDGIVIRGGVHRFVCMAFHGLPPEGLPHAAHRDGDKQNNRPGNLRWASIAENNEDRRAHGSHPMGNVLPHAKLTPAKVLEVLRLKGHGLSNEAIARRFGVSGVAIRKVLTGRSWRQVTGFSPAPEILAEIARLNAQVPA